MSGEKEHIDSQGEKCYEIENISDFFDNEEIKSELYSSLGINGFINWIIKKYKDKSLDLETQREIEKISHYHIAKLLYDKKMVNHIEEFSTSKRTLKSCFKGNLEDIELLWRALIPVMFSSVKEHFVGGNSWKDHLNRFTEEDFENILASAKGWTNTEDFSSLKPSGLSNKQFISEIRNALNHTHYVFGPEGLYIKNPKNRHHKQEFEMELPYSFLLLFVLNIPHFLPKNSLGIHMYCDDEKIYSNEKDLKFDDFKDKLHVYQYVAEGKNADDATTKKREINLSKYLIGDVGEAVEENLVKGDSEETRINLLERGGLLTDYFSKEKLDTKRLEYVLVSLGMSSLIIPMSVLVYLLLIERKANYKGLKSSELVDNTFDLFYAIFSDYLTSCTTYPQDMDKAVMNYHLDTRGDNIEELDKVSAEKSDIFWKIIAELRTAKQKINGQSIMKTTEGCWKYAQKYLAESKFKLDGNVFRKGEIKISQEELLNLCWFTCDDYFTINSIVETFPNRLKVQMIKMVYLNELIPLENGENGKKSERERIRNAFAHDNYTILAGVDQIVLRDGYSHSSDKWNRERLYKLSELYEDTFKAMDESMKNTKLNIDLI